MNAPAPQRDPWRRFLVRFLVTAMVVAAAVLAAIVLLDPYGMLGIVAERQPMMVSNQRYAYPPLARDPQYDSAVLGNSTMRLLKTSKLNAAFHTRFAQLSLNNGQAYEQYRMGQLYLRHHPDPKVMLYGVDQVWCREGPAVRKFPMGPLPEWMYDENPWNDLWNQLNRNALEAGWRLVLYRLGHEKPRFDPDGYHTFLPPPGAYDLKRARKHIYGARLSLSDVQPLSSPISAEALRGVELGALPWLAALLNAPPASTLRVVMFVPYHRYIQPRPNTRGDAVWAECKRRIAHLAHEAGNSRVIDFMIASEITTHDDNYWDPLHYRDPIADLLVQLIAEAVRTGKGRPGYYRILDEPEGTTASAAR